MDGPLNGRGAYDRCRMAPATRVLGGRHFIADLALPYGSMTYDYLREQGRSESERWALELG